MVLSSCQLFLVTSLGAVGYARCAKHRMLSQKLVWFLSFFSQYSRIEFSRFAGEDIDSSAPYNIKTCSHVTKFEPVSFMILQGTIISGVNSMSGFIASFHVFQPILISERAHVSKRMTTIPFHIQVLPITGIKLGSHGREARALSTTLLGHSYW